MSKTLQVALRGEGPARTGRWVRGLCAAHDLADLRDDALLMVSGLVINAVLRADTDCGLVAALGDRSVRVDVREKEYQPVVPVEVAGGSQRGRGLDLGAALSTTWCAICRAAGKSVWFTLVRGCGSQPCGGVQGASRAARTWWQVRREG